MKYLFIIILSIPLLSTTILADTLKPFESDGCSAFPNGTFSQNELWLSCCQAHDYAYWQGGTYQNRLDADRELRDCVSHVGKPEIALLMLAGVRVGGSPYFPTKFRWGYGWLYPAFYGELSPLQKLQIHHLSPATKNNEAN